MSQRKKYHRGRRKKSKSWIGISLSFVLIAGITIGGTCLYKRFGANTINEVKMAVTAQGREAAAKSNAQIQSLVAELKKAREERMRFEVQPGNVPGALEQSEEKVVYLTLDDGPSANTPAVLDILDRYNAKATFFVTGAMSDYAYLIKEEFDRGHTVGLHTYTHDYGKVYASVDAYFQDLDAIGQLVKEQIGYVPCFIRFPGGSSNTVSRKYTPGIMTQLATAVQEKGYQYYDWNASSGDGSVLGTEELIQNATSFNANNIVLLSHDAAAKQTTVEALPAIIEHYQALGYTFKALDRDSFVPHHGINN